MKTKKVLLLYANSSVKRERAHPKELESLLNAVSGDIEIHTSMARSLSYLITNERMRIRDHKNHMDLEDYDLVYFRKAGGAMQQMATCAHYLNDRGVPFYDRELIRSGSRNKLSMMAMLQRKNIPVPATLFCRNRRRVKRLVIKTYRDTFGFPIILKATGGSRGDANYKIDNPEELDIRLAAEPNRSFMVQEFIPNKGDYRFFVAGGNLRGVIERLTAEGTHLSNTSKGAQATMVDTGSFNETVRTQAVQSALIFGRDVAGVDVMFDTRNGKHYILEVNRAPQIERSSFETEKAQWMVQAFNDTIVDYQPPSQRTSAYDRNIIGRFEAVRVYDSGGAASEKYVAKIDTGADSSSIDARNIRVVNEILVAEIDDKEHSFSEFFEKKVKSSNGQLETRYIVNLTIKIGQEEFTLRTGLTDRSSMKHRLLIGRRFLRANNLLVDVSRRYILSGKNN